MKEKLPNHTALEGSFLDMVRIPVFLRIVRGPTKSDGRELLGYPKLSIYTKGVHVVRPVIVYLHLISVITTVVCN